MNRHRRHWKIQVWIHIIRLNFIEGIEPQDAAWAIILDPDDAVEEGLAADEAVIGAHRGLPGHMFAAAEADLQLQRAIVTEQRLQCDRTVLGDRNARQQFLDQRRLARAQRMALATAVEAPDGGRIGHGGAP